MYLCAMNCEIITIGDELLIGQVIDTNSAYIANRLNEIGIRVTRRTAVGDVPDDMINVLSDASLRASVILMTGGLGPTKDDKTKDVLCDYFGTSLTFNESSFKDLEELFKTRGREMTELNRSQAELPDNCIALQNKLGTAPGMWFDHNDKIYISLPGVPYEMENLMKEQVLPRLKERFKLEAVFHRTIQTTGLAESVLADRIREWESALPPCFKLAYLPAPGIVRLRLTGEGKTYDELKALSEKCIADLRELIGDQIFGYDDERLPEVIGKLLKSQNQTVSVAESCSGGYLAHLITSIAGSSEYFKGGIVPYDNSFKTKLLSVDKELILTKGAVSEEVVIEMARNCRKLFDTDYALSISGIAGPGGATPEKSVGLVWMAIATRDKVQARKFQFGKNRTLNITLTANSALELLRREILGLLNAN